MIVFVVVKVDCSRDCVVVYDDNVLRDGERR